MKIRYIGQYDSPAIQRGKAYEVMSIERDWYRIMTELDEDYLVPPSAFEVVED